MHAVVQPVEAIDVVGVYRWLLQFFLYDIGSRNRPSYNPSSSEITPSRIRIPERKRTAPHQRRRSSFSDAFVAAQPPAIWTTTYTTRSRQGSWSLQKEDTRGGPYCTALQHRNSALSRSEDKPAVFFENGH
jgi:hypothetical protein